MREDLYLSVGDTAPVEVWIVDANGTPVDLTGATVTIYATRETSYFGRAWPMDTSTPDAADVSGATCTPDADQDANQGLCSWTPVLADTDTAGTFALQARVSTGAGVRHYPPSLGERVLVIGSGLNP